MLASAQVVEQAATLVRLAATLASSTHTDRGWPFDESELPAAKVFAEAEDITPMTVHAGSPQLHELQILVQIDVVASTALDDAMHQVTADVLASLNSPAALSAVFGLGVQTWATRRIERSMAERGQAKVGHIDITLAASFHTLAADPETILGAAP